VRDSPTDRANDDAMQVQHVQAVFQAISSMAIMGGFVYTAFQFRNWRRAQHVANFTKLVELQMSLRRMRVDNPSLAAVHAHDVEGLNSEREIREYFLNLMQLSVFEIAWFSRRQGQLSEDYFRSWAQRMEVIAAEESFRRMLAKPSMKIMHDEFQRYIQGMSERTEGGTRSGGDGLARGDGGP
jgi:hypothetical protein